MTVDHPEGFAGFATLPMRDFKAAIGELERGMVQLGLKGAMINDHVHVRTFEWHRDRAGGSPGSGS